MLSGPTLGSLIKSNLSGANGSNLDKFTTALGTGIVNGIVGKAFVTADVGVGVGGAGTGTGITGLSSDAMSTSAISAMKSTGSNAQIMMDAIMKSVVQHLSNASLVSVDPLVGIGNGTIVIGSIAVSTDDMASQIQSSLAGAGAKGSNMPNLCTAIATGICTNIQSSGTGSLIIAGGVVPPVPVPTSGPGTGTIS